MNTILFNFLETKYKELFVHQQEALKRIIKNRLLYMEWDVGTGKTYFIGYFVKYLEYVFPQKRSIIVCPPGTFPSMKESFEKLDVKDFIILETTEQKKEYTYTRKYRDKRVVVISNGSFPLVDYSKVNTEDSSLETSLLDHKPDVFILDEAHTINGQRSKISSAVKSYVDMINPTYRILGSGTPIGNNFHEFFNCMHVLNREEFGHSFWKFRATYFFDESRFTGKGYPSFILKKDLRDEYLGKVSKYKQRVEKKDVGKLPKLHKLQRKLEFLPEQRKLYNQLKNEFAVDFEIARKELKKKIKANPKDRGRLYIQFYAHTLTQISALRQICSGFVYEQIDKDLSDEEKKKRMKNRQVMVVPTQKIIQLEKGLNNIKKMKTKDKLIIWSVFTETFSQIEKVIKGAGLGYVKITGKTPIHKRTNLIQNWNNNDDIQVFLSHPKSGGVGLNLQKAKYALFYSQDYSFIDKVQAEGRNNRIGSIDFHSDIVYSEYLIKGSIETEINYKLRNKKEMANLFSDYLKER